MSDLIDRQAAIELILSGKVGDDSTEWVGVECPEECNSFLDWAAEEVGKMPSAERKKGKWEITDAYPHNVYCSECHKRFAQTQWAVWEDGTLPRNFCPNCGADMREREGE